MADEKKYISSIKQGDTKYALKDAEARTQITEVENEQIHLQVIADDTLEITKGPQSQE